MESCAVLIFQTEVFDGILGMAWNSDAVGGISPPLDQIFADKVILFLHINVYHTTKAAIRKVDGSQFKTLKEA